MNKTPLIKFITLIIVAIFIFGANFLYKLSAREGASTLLIDSQYPTAFVKDVAKAKKSIKCAMYMFKLDSYIKDDIYKPVPMMGFALLTAAEKGINVSLIFDIGKEKELTTKFNKSTAKLFEEKNIKVIFDSTKKRLHTKMCVIDEEIVYIGSHNFTNSAMLYNSEVSVRIQSKDLAKDSLKYLEGLGL